MRLGNGSSYRIVDLGPSGWRLFRLPCSRSLWKGTVPWRTPTFSRWLKHQRTPWRPGCASRPPGTVTTPPGPSNCRWPSAAAAITCMKELSHTLFFPLLSQCFRQSLHVFQVSWEFERTYSLFQADSKVVTRLCASTTFCSQPPALLFQLWGAGACALANVKFWIFCWQDLFQNQDDSNFY